jgi:hypothetical protein
MFNAIGGTVTAEEAYAWEDAYLRAKAKRH